MNRIGFPAEIDQPNLDFAPIIGVDGAGGIDHGDAMLDRQTGSRPHLNFIPRRDGHGKAAANQANFSRCKDQGGCKSRAYIHAGGKIGVLVDLAGSGDLGGLAKDIAMHSAAAAPQFVRREQVSTDVLEREKEIYRAKARETGKPENIIEKIIEGQVNKFYGEICLVEQVFVKDTDKTIQQVLKAAGADVAVNRFERFVLGEGLEKKQTDFAAEVAAAAGTN